MVWMESLFGQVSIQLYLTLLTLCMLLDRRRIYSDVVYVIEIINEITIILLTYVMIGYGMFVQRGTAKHKLGKFNATLLLSSIGINVIVLIYNSIRGAYRWLRYKIWHKKCVRQLRSRWSNKRVKKEAM